MRVFVTGASGFIGSAVVPELIAHGHDVVGLARSEASAEKVAAAGAEVVRGDLDDLDVLRAAAADSEGAVHLAFIHDFSRFADSVRADLAAIDAMGSALEGSGRPFVYASGVLGLAPGRLGTERDLPDPASTPRVASATAVLGLADRGVRSSIVRLAPSVHGVGDKGFMKMLVDIAREKGVSAYPGDGTSRWPGIHRFDAARLFRLGLEKPPAGSVLHGAGEEGVQIRAVAEVIGRHLGVPVAPVAPEDAAAHFGFLGPLLMLESPVSNALTRELLGWEPEGPGLLEDLDLGHYFEA